MDEYNGSGSIFSRVKHRLLGHILVDGEFISQQDLAMALEKQRESNQQLGEVLIGMGVLDPVCLSMVLALQKNLGSLADAVKVAAGVRQVLGELLVKARQISRKDLNQALREQRKTGEKLGEILVDHGVLNEAGLEAILRFQKNQELPAGDSANFRLGEILVASRYITRRQLEDALRKQRLSNKKIGSILVEEGYTTQRHVSRGLKLQSMLVTAAVTTILVFAGAPQHDRAYADPASGKVHVSARVVAHSKIRILHQVSRVRVTPADIKRGYVDIGSASRFEVHSNNPQGYVLAFHGVATPFKAVHAKGNGTDVYLDGGHGFVQRPYVRGSEVIEFSYRLVLSEDVQPGTYAWPINFTVQPA